MKRLTVFIRECLWLLWMVFFRPRSFVKAVESFSRNRQRQLIVLTILTTITVPYLLTIIAGMLLHWESHLLVSRLFYVVLSAAMGMVVGTGIGMLVRMWGGMAKGVAAGTAACVVLGVMFSIGKGRLFSTAVGIAIGVMFGIGENETSIGMVGGIMAGMACGVTFGVTEGMMKGMAVDVASGITASMGFLRVFFLPIEAITTLWAIGKAKRQTQPASRLLRYSLAYWDEVMPLPQPFLTPLLVLVGEQNPAAFERAIVHLTTRTFQQRAAMNALLELNGHAMLRCRTVEEIAQFVEPTDWRPPASRLDVDATTARQQCLRISIDIGTALASTSNYQKLTALHRASRQLDALRDFAVLELRGRNSRMFVQIAKQWQDAVNGEIDRLTEEDRVTDSIPNPYVAPRPLTLTDEIFVGRTEVFRFVEEHFLRGARNTPIVLHGQPRIGKSSVLRHFATHLPTNLISVYVDMQRAAQVESTGGLLYNLADTVAQELAGRGIVLKTPALKDYAAEPFIVFGKFLDAVEKAIHAPENRIILALDEFEEIERKLTESKVSRDLMPFLRNMMQHRQGMALLFAGTHTLDEMIHDNWIPYFRSAVPCRVSYLNEADARKLITNPIASFTLDYEPEAVEHLLQTTHCHPCLIQLACSALVDAKNEQHSRYASLGDVQQALTKALETGAYVFHSLWDWIPMGERRMLSALAAEKQAAASPLARQLQLPEKDVRGMAERLTEAEVIEALPAEHGEPFYRFQVELFRQWVERHAARSGYTASQPDNVAVSP